ncbi:MAG: GGDEF domain-containing protein [Desulfobacteraceae bacterium]|nr:MAG: GGDEF domain-containing protein [Desulfobacteraceae bacterium]
MSKTYATLENLFYHQEDMPSEDILLLLNDIGVPEEVCWRTIYRIIFDPGVNLNANMDQAITRRQLEPVMKKALDNSRKNVYTDKALVALIADYHKATFSVCHQQLSDVLSDLDNLLSEFKSMSLSKKEKVEALESDTISTIQSDLSIEEKTRLIKSRFKETIDMFQKDMEVLDQKTHTDHMTGLYNRRFFDEQLEMEAIQALKEKTWLNLLMIDIDDFKRFNDKFGHVIGDQALKIIAKHIQGVCSDETRKTGMFFYPTRYGGEEFAVIVPAVDQKDAFHVAESIREKVADYTFVIRNKEGKIMHKNLNLTISVGVAALNHVLADELVMEQLVEDADSAMYEAKKAGKNRVRIKELP